jgi:hypothetical protein
MKYLLALYKYLKITTLSKENVLVLPEFLKNKNKKKNNIDEKSPSFARILEKQVLC